MKVAFRQHTIAPEILHGEIVYSFTRTVKKPDPTRRSWGSPVMANVETAFAVVKLTTGVTQTGKELKPAFLEIPYTELTPL